MKINSPQFNLMQKACVKASKVLIRDFGEVEKLQVSEKGPGDFVTASDKRVEKIIINELEKSGYSILSEETGLIEGKTKDKKWVIDPIDGTFNFLNGLPHFAISIAYEEKSEIVSGMIFDPIKNEMFFAEKNNGAFFNNQRIKVSKKNDLNQCLFASNGKNFISSELAIRKTGCAALDLAYVSSGRFDGFFQDELNLWDIAAGIVLVKEAGGIVNEINLSINKKIKVRASSLEINTKMLEKLANF